MDFLSTVKQRAKANRKTIVLPESSDIRMLRAAETILSENIANLILVGNEAEIKAKSDGLNLSAAKIIDPAAYGGTAGLTAKLYELRKAKGLTEEQAAALIQNPLYFGNMLVLEGLADGMVAGAVNSTADVMRSSLQILKTAPGVKLVSTFFVMTVPDCDMGHEGVFVFADCGLNQNPNAEELAAIAVSSAQSFKQLVGAEPVVAMLSHSSKGSAKHADVDKVTEALKLAKQAAPNLNIDGELQLDAAIVPSVGKSKAPDSAAAGKANVLVFPDLDAGNIGYKLVERLAKANAYGPVTQGIAKPVNDLSRGCSAEDIVGVVAITAVQAQ
jgi:phosphate acetyltransferase